MADKIKQLSLILENKPGQLAQVCTALAQEKINISAITVAEHNDRRVLRLVTDDLVRTRKALKNFDLPMSEDEVVMVSMTNRPGALAHVCEQLASEHINIDYAYSNATSQNGKAIGIFKVSNTPRTLKILTESGKPKTNGWSRKGRTAKSAAAESD
jgi:hypothetical protein